MSKSEASEAQALPAELAFSVPSAARMLALGRQLSSLLRGGMVVHLTGGLGSGKTTLVRGILDGLGHAAAVPSPTYALVADYDCAAFPIHHLDLYRLQGSAQIEAEDMGIREYFDAGALCLVEWPERLALPPPDLCIGLAFRGRGRGVCIRYGGGHAGLLQSGIEKIVSKFILRGVSR